MPDPALDAFTSRANRDPFTEHDLPSAWSDTVAAGFAMTRREEISSSAGNNWAMKNAERAKKIGELGGDEQVARGYANEPFVMREWRRLEQEQGPGSQALNSWRASLPFAAKSYDLVREYEKRFPGQVLDDQALADEWKQQAAQLRVRDQDVLERGSGFASFVGAAGATMTDPLVLATLPLGAGEAVAGRSVLQTVGRTALVEGGVGAATEIPIQAQVYAYKREIESPWSAGDSAMNVLAAGAGGAAIGGTIAGGIAGFKKVLEKYRAARDAGKFTPTAEMDAAETALEDAVHLQEQNPLRTDTGSEELAADLHARALDKARTQNEAGAPVDVENIAAGSGLEQPDPVRDVVNRAHDPSALVDVDPLKLAIDAKTFQFKGGGDAEGVTSTLRDVERFDRRLAGVALIWERADGQQFIADGHQRVALARRAIAAGQDAAEVRLNGFVLREADGVTAADARRMAAVKNMAEGSGSALDAAKILRDVGPTGEALLPPLPPRSALVKQARGLAALGEDEFLQVVNGVVDTNVGALVGAATPDPKLQSAMIEVLRRASPSNEAQARSIIEQVKTQGLETRTTEDLFGEASFSESLYLERAQVLDAALKVARQDKVVFGGLIRNEERIAGAGSNRLDRAANVARQQEATDAAQQITIRANAKGPLSDALTEAARKVREGGRAGDAAKAFLEAARREILAGDSRRSAAGAARSGSAKASETQVTSRKPIALHELPPDQRPAVKLAFKEKQASQTIDDLYVVAEAHQAKLVKALEQISDEIGDEVTLKNPGIKKRATSEEKILRKGYKDAGSLTDVIRAGLLTRTPEQARQIIERLARTFEVLDEGINYTNMGYLDHTALVRFPDGKVAEVQIWADSVWNAKKKAHKLYAVDRKLTPEQLATPEGAAQRAALTEESKALYAQALADASFEWRQVAMMALSEDMRVRVQDLLAGKGAGAGSAGTPGNISKKAERDIGTPDSSTSTGEARLQEDSPGTMKKDSTPPSSVGRVTAGRPSQLKNSSAIDSPPRSIIQKVDDPRSGDPTKSKTGTVEDADYDAVMSEYQDLLDDHGALLKVTNEVNGELIERQAAAVIDELDTLEETLERVRLCSVPARAA